MPESHEGWGYAMIVVDVVAWIALISLSEGFAPHGSLLLTRADWKFLLNVLLILTALTILYTIVQAAGRGNSS